MLTFMMSAQQFLPTRLLQGTARKRSSSTRDLITRGMTVRVGMEARGFSHERTLADVVLERADSIDSNAYDIAARQREVVCWDNAGPSHQKHALGKAVFTEEKPG